MSSLAIFRRSGFTFTEMLLVIVLIGIVAVVSSALIYSGIGLWRRIHFTLEKDQLNIMLWRFSEDTRNSFVFAKIPFIGTSQRWECPILVRGRLSPSKTIGKVAYVYDPQRKHLERIVWDYSGVFSHDEGIKRDVLDDISQCHFSYYVYSQEDGQYHWQEDLPAGILPIAVRLELLWQKEGISFNKTAEINYGY